VRHAGCLWWRWLRNHADSNTHPNTHAHADSNPNADPNPYTHAHCAAGAIG
jgi:hypothetical protein